MHRRVRHMKEIYLKTRFSATSLYSEGYRFKSRHSYLLCRFSFVFSF